MERQGKEDLIVVLGAPDARTVRLYADTLIGGDPSFLGALGGISLGLPVYHILEPEIKGQLDQACYERHIKPLQTGIDIPSITDMLRRDRSTS